MLVLLDAVRKVIDSNLFLVFDEAHLLVGKQRLKYVEGDKLVDGVSAMALGLRKLSAVLRGVIFCGTQVSLETGIRLASAIFKHSTKIPVLALCKAPFLDGVDRDASFSVG